MYNGYKDQKYLSPMLMKGHWSRMTKYLVDLYQCSLKGVETNFPEYNNPLGNSHMKTHLRVGDQVGPNLLTWKLVIFLKMGM